MLRYTETLALTDEQVALKESIHKFCKEVLRPASVELDKLADPEDVIKKGSLFWKVMKQAYELGYHTASIDPMYGGMGFGPVETHIFLEEMGWASADFAIAIGVSSFPFSTAANSMDDDLIKNVVRPFVEDKDAKFIGCWAITEPEHGSDSLVVGTEEFSKGNITFTTTAKLDGDQWVINGQKSSWVSNGIVATHALTFLTIDASRGMNGGGVAIVPLNSPGVQKGRSLNKIGQRALNQGEFVLEDVRIPANYMLAQPDMYPMAMHMTLAGANAAMGAIFTGCARAAFEEALDYCKVRVQGGKPLVEHQWIQQKLFDMFRKVEAARALSRTALIYNSQTLPPAVELSIAAKITATQAAFEVANDAVQLFGGYGLSKEYTIEKIFRDARASLIEDGCNEVLALAGAKAVLGKY
ncbi:MAG: acyl-CoA dehydrogenase [Candidatus Abyssobacteria bacterium SURF_5]|uniref:Acyl-CoA dehydrogenase n=1 Tax=Abyssobacteria bacterium (strain SURF_5) TaxID=2093360 RepID=A0A3A4P1X2_ABYX5|nr:MAG: acyl-CoA dehydrogenase [Candidatus Abyssubacteria bacterium SURF_5]